MATCYWKKFNYGEKKLMLLECKGENMDGQRELPDHRNECVMCPAVIMWSVWNNDICLVHSDE